MYLILNLKERDVKMEKCKRTGIGFCELLTVVFIVLKLTNVIAWSWLWVLSPIWIPIAIILVAVIIYTIYLLSFF